MLFVGVVMPTTKVLVPMLFCRLQFTSISRFLPAFLWIFLFLAVLVILPLFTAFLQGVPLPVFKAVQPLQFLEILFLNQLCQLLSHSTSKFFGHQAYVSKFEGHAFSFFFPLLSWMPNLSRSVTETKVLWLKLQTYKV